MWGVPADPTCIERKGGGGGELAPGCGVGPVKSTCGVRANG